MGRLLLYKSGALYDSTLTLGGAAAVFDNVTASLLDSTGLTSAAGLSDSPSTAIQSLVGLGGAAFITPDVLAALLASLHASGQLTLSAGGQLTLATASGLSALIAVAYQDNRAPQTFTDALALLSSSTYNTDTNAIRQGLTDPLTLVATTDVAALHTLAAMLATQITADLTTVSTHMAHLMTLLGGQGTMASDAQTALTSNLTLSASAVFFLIAQILNRSSTPMIAEFVRESFGMPALSNEQLQVLTMMVCEQLRSATLDNEHWGPPHA